MYLEVNISILWFGTFLWTSYGTKIATV